jgi:hypothetical protein
VAEVDEHAPAPVGECAAAKGVEVAVAYRRGGDAGRGLDWRLSAGGLMRLRRRRRRGSRACGARLGVCTCAALVRGRRIGAAAAWSVTGRTLQDEKKKHTSAVQGCGQRPARTGGQGGRG